MSVLFVDDDPEILSIYKKQAERTGIKKFDMASNGAEAWNLLQKNEYTFVFADLKMPKMDGITLMEKLADEMKDSAPTVVIVSGDSNMLHKAMKKFGSVNILAKPIQNKDFTDLIARLSIC